VNHPAIIRTTICAAAIATGGIATTAGVAGAGDAPVLTPARPVDRGDVRFQPGIDSVRRIEFAPGTSRDAVAGHVGGDEIDRFVLWGEAGQLMPVWLDSLENNADLSVTDGDGHPIHETIDGFVLPYSADYFIDVWSDGPESNYTLTVAID